MTRLTDEEVITELKNFTSYKMNSDQKQSIENELNRLSSKKSSSTIFRFYKPLLSVIVLLFLLVSGSYFAMNQAEDKTMKHTTGSGIFLQGDETFKIKNSDDFIMKRNKDGSVFFMADGKKVGGIEPLTEDEKMKSIQTQNPFVSQDLEGFRYSGTYNLDHQKTMDVVQIHHYYFNSPHSKLNYHVYFHTPFFNEDTAADFAHSFKIYNDGKLLQGSSEDWTLSTEFATPTFEVLLGEKDEIGIAGPPLIAGKTDKFLWHFFGSHNEIEILTRGDFKVIATNKKSGEHERVLVQNSSMVWSYKFQKDSPLSPIEEVGSIHSIPVNMKFSKSGIYRLDTYFGGERFGSIVVEVK
ncbi:hypothetical protein [Fictibacillus phosphorivorans]|uniref:hypothetical protein n=1 Tax=Fictibacillus phosphorivorans TaxID=1221500 RepID=UPI0012939E0A|nr:hypothetical protein [Fictibacillus phosphorivorans]MQR97041.1 hypothetical protein [Fictibacillus phosphorivorans]